MRRIPIRHAYNSTMIALVLFFGICVSSNSAVAVEIPDDPDDMVHFCSAAILITSYLNVGDPALQKKIEDELLLWQGLIQDDAKMRRYASELLHVFGAGGVTNMEIIEAAHNCIEVRKSADGEK